MRWLFFLGMGLLLGCASIEVPEEGDELKVPTNMEALHRSVAYSLLQNHQPEEAIPHIQKLLNKNPKQAEPHYLMGRALLVMKLFNPAQEELEIAIRLDEKLVRAHALLGVLWDLVGEHEKAEEYHRRSIGLSPQSASYYNNLGFGLFLQKHYRKAQEAFEQALKLNPRLTNAHINLGFALGMAGDIDKAFEQFVVVGSKDQAYNNIGYIHELRGEWEDAVNCYQKSIQDNPQQERAQKNLAHVYSQVGDNIFSVPIGEGSTK